MSRDDLQADAAAMHADAARLLRFLTAGCVDDGKSTLIGRLLYDSRAIFADQLDAHRARRTSAPWASAIDLSLLTDGLEAEREQGITIDVAYRYFATPKRKFIIADTPGHEQYTRNMVTGASSSRCRHHPGRRLQGRSCARTAASSCCRRRARHSLHRASAARASTSFAVNKMDLVDYDRGRCTSASSRPTEIRAAAGPATTSRSIPLSALARRQRRRPPATSWPWYDGPTLMRTAGIAAVVRRSARTSRSASRCS